MRTIRRLLDGLYALSGAIAAVCLIAIVVLVVAQWGARVAGVRFSIGAPWAGYAMAAASFFGFSYALNHAAHIRVTLALAHLGRLRYFAEVWCFAVGTVITTWFAWYACQFTYQSWRFNDISAGADATPLWIPQLGMAAGSIIFAICFADNLLSLLLRGEANFSDDEEVAE